MVRLAFAAAVALLAVIVAPPPVRADSASDAVLIAQRLQRWTADFNAKDSAGICDLFAPDLIYSVPEVQQATRETMCKNLDKILARSDLQLHYDNPEIHETIVSGDLAVVRLTWTLTTQLKGAIDTTKEEGIDIFRRQPDGRWLIARFIAFAPRMNKLLQ